MKMNFDYFVTFYVSCLERYLIVCWNHEENTYEVERQTPTGSCITWKEVVCEDQVERILQERYDKWNSPEDYPDEYDEIFFSCCEEYMLAGLDEVGLQYTPIYIGDTD